MTTKPTTLPWPMLSAIVRARGACAKCGRRFDASELDADHIVPRRVGGGDSLSNLQALCKPCHLLKTAAENQVYGSAPSVYRSLLNPAPVPATGRYPGLASRHDIATNALVRLLTERTTKG